MTSSGRGRRGSGRARIRAALKEVRPAALNTAPIHWRLLPERVTFGDAERDYAVIVRPIRIRAEDGRDDSSWLTLGAEYVVLSIQHARGQAQVRLITNEGGRSHGLFPMELFEVVDGRPSGIWTVRNDKSGLTLEPAAWGRDDFWADMHADTPVARPLAEIDERARRSTQEFDSAVTDMYTEAGRVWPNGPNASRDVPTR